MKWRTQCLVLLWVLVGSVCPLVIPRHNLCDRDADGTCYDPKAQPYFVYQDSWDANPSDYCQTAINNNQTCLDLCQVNLTELTMNATYNDHIYSLINYCSYCLDEEAMRYRLLLNESKCNHFGLNLVGEMTRQCKGRIGIVENRLFLRDTFYRRQMLRMNTTALNESLYFSTLFNSSSVGMPTLCLCDDTGRLAYDCNDAYRYFLMPMKFTIFPLMLFISHTLLATIFFFYCTIPHCRGKFIRINKRFLEINARTNVWRGWTSLRCTLEEIFLRDVKAQIIIPNSVACIFYSMENLSSFLMNFEAWAVAIDTNIWGSFRSIAVFSTGLTICLLLVDWAHVIQKLNTQQENISRPILALLGVVYVLDPLFITVGIILAIVTRKTMYLFMLAAISMVLLTSVYCTEFL